MRRSVMVAVAVVVLMALLGTPRHAAAQGQAGQAGQAQAPGQPAVLDGDVEVQYEDAATSARLLHFLRTDTGRRIQLQFAGSPPDLVTGSRIRARGQLRADNTLALTSDGTSVTTLALASPNTFGAQRTLVMLINFSNNRTTPYTVAAAQDVTFTQTSNFFRENSYGQTWLEGTVVGWLPIAADSSTTCDTNTWASLADQEATRAGIVLSNFTRKVYAFPQTSACGWWGLGTVGGNPSRAWINGSYAVRVLGHEMGHNFALYHSHSSQCTTVGCEVIEYGDDHDIMGSVTAHFNAFQKERIGWLNYGTSPGVATVTQSGNHWIDAMAPVGANPKALKVLKAIDSSGRRTWYYIETRARVGFDGNVVQGVVVHTGSEATGNSSYQIDLQLATSSFDGLLDVGQSFVDDALGLTITTLSADGAGASVAVTFGTAGCLRGAPSVAFSPSLSPYLVPGSSYTYGVTVTSNDSPGCAPADFPVSPSVPSGWTVTSGATALTLSPAASASTTFTVTSPAGQADGSYPVAATVLNGADTTRTASAGGTHRILSSIAVSVSAGQASYSRMQTATLSARVMSGSVPVAGTTVSFTLTKPNGTVVSASATSDVNGLVTWSFKLGKRDPVGTWLAAARAALGTVSGTGTTSFIVQ